MDRSCMIMHLTTPFTPCIIFILVSHTCMFVIDPAEQEREEPSALAPVEGGNYKQEQGKPRCI
jgi:hypothetical protein